MGLFQKAIETYDAIQSLAGVKMEGKEPLAPLGYMIAKAEIEITIDANGKFIRADRIEEKIPIPCTESSAGRSGKGAANIAHPLCDRFYYVAEYDKQKHDAYIAAINAWNNSGFGNEKLDAICKYLKKNRVLKDCKAAGVLKFDKYGEIKSGKDVVTWRVEGLGENSGTVHEDQQLMKNYYKYCISTSASPKGMCMITGEEDILASQHLKGLSIFSANAKLITSNDTTNFTFLGRFMDSTEAFTMGYTASQKAHNALKWLTANYGINIGNCTVICWSPQGKEIPKFTMPLMTKSDTDVLPSDYKNDLKSLIHGYKCNFEPTDDVVLAILGTVSGKTGRLSITYYDEMKGSDFFDRLYNWDATCCWYDNRWGVQSPSLSQIINFAYGNLIDGQFVCKDTFFASQMQNLISCKMHQHLIPRNIVQNLFHRCSNIQVYKKQQTVNGTDDQQNNKSKHLADKLLMVTCAVIRKYRYDYYKETWEMTLEENKPDRSYQLGRLLAVLEKMEIDATNSDSARQTNAIRLQQYYMQRPFTAFNKIITTLKTAYVSKLPIKSQTFYEKLIQEIMVAIPDDTPDNLNKPLTETAMMGYFLQKNALYTKKGKTEKEEEN